MQVSNRRERTARKKERLLIQRPSKSKLTDFFLYKLPPLFIKGGLIYKTKQLLFNHLKKKTTITNRLKIHYEIKSNR